MCVQYCGGAQYHGVFSAVGDIMCTMGDILSTLGIQYHGGYHDACRGYHEYPGVFSTVGEIFCYLSTPLYFTPPW